MDNLRAKLMIKAGAAMRVAAMKTALLAVCVMLPCKWAAVLRRNQVPLLPRALVAFTTRSHGTRAL